MKKSVSFFIEVFLFLFCATAVFATDPWQVKFTFNQKKTTAGVWPSEQTYTETVEAKNEQDALGQVAAMKGVPASEKTRYKKWLADGIVLYFWQENGMSYQIKFISAEKVKKVKNSNQKAPKEPKQDWVDKNLPPLKL
jgi:hypothetical protein